ncbi:MAG: replication initiation protein [Flavobacteriaceae bacterium]|nr:replication initiation protein [Flavobacteriaceae bacterium]
MNKLLKIDRNRAKITTSSDLAEAQYYLTNLEQKLVSYTLSSINPISDEKLGSHSFDIPDILDFLGISYKTGFYHFKEVIDSLRNKDIRIYRKDTNSYLETKWISHVEWFFDENRIEIGFANKLSPYLLSLKESFSSYFLKHIGSLNSTYSIRLFMILSQYKHKGRENIIYEVDTLKEMLSPVENKLNKDVQKYKKYNDFKKRVIDPSVEDINKHSQLIVSYEPMKKGRKIVSLCFNVSYKENSLKIENTKNIDTEKSEIAIALEAFGLDLDSIENYSNQYDDDRLKRSLDYTLSRKEAGLIKTSDFSYFHTVLSNDYGKKTAAQLKKDKKLEDSKQKKLQEEYLQLSLDKLRNEIEFIKKNRYNDYKDSVGALRVHKDLDKIWKTELNSKDLKHPLPRDHKATELLLVSIHKSQVATINNEDIIELVQKEFEEVELQDKLVNVLLEEEKAAIDL